MENNQIIIKLNNNVQIESIKGKCKASNFHKQIKLLKSLGGQNEK
jgi:hypothetical protein